MRDGPRGALVAAAVENDNTVTLLQAQDAAEIMCLTVADIDDVSAKVTIDKQA